MYMYLANNASCVLVPYQYPQCRWRNIGSTASPLLKPSLFEEAFISLAVSVPITALGIKI